MNDIIETQQKYIAILTEKLVEKTEAMDKLTHAARVIAADIEALVPDEPSEAPRWVHDLLEEISNLKCWVRK